MWYMIQTAAAGVTGGRDSGMGRMGMLLEVMDEAIKEEEEERGLIKRG